MQVLRVDEDRRAVSTTSGQMKKKVVGLFLAKAQLLEWWRQNAPKMAKSAGFGGCGTFALRGLPRNCQTTAADDETVRDGVCYRFGRLPRRLADGRVALVLSTNTTQSNASPPPVDVRAPQVLAETVLRCRDTRNNTLRHPRPASVSTTQEMQRKDLRHLSKDL